MRPLFYTDCEGGYWKDWPSEKTFDPSWQFLRRKPNELVKLPPGPDGTVNMGGLVVHSLVFKDLENSENRFDRWDCFHGWMNWPGWTPFSSRLSWLAGVSEKVRAKFIKKEDKRLKKEREIPVNA